LNQSTVRLEHRKMCCPDALVTLDAQTIRQQYEEERLKIEGTAGFPPAINAQKATNVISSRTGFEGKANAHAEDLE